MNISMNDIYSICKKKDKMFALIFDLPIDGNVTFEWRWIGFSDGNTYKYSKSISINDIQRMRFPDQAIICIANEDNWK